MQIELQTSILTVETLITCSKTETIKTSIHIGQRPRRDISLQDRDDRDRETFCCLAEMRRCQLVTLRDRRSRDRDVDLDYQPSWNSLQTPAKPWNYVIMTSNLKISYSSYQMKLFISLLLIHYRSDWSYFE
jgi:hypothetical protein